MSTKKRTEKTRPASIPTPQSNQEPKLNGSEVTPSSDALSSLGLQLLSRFSFSLPSGTIEEKDESISSPDLGVEDVSFTKMLIADAMEASGDNLSAFIVGCEAASKLLKKDAKALLSKAENAFLAWASGFPMAGNIHLDNEKGSKLELDKGEFERSTKALYYALGKLSNNAIFGRKPNAEGKGEVKSIFQSSTKGAKLLGFSGKNSTHYAIAEVNTVVLDNGGYVQKSIELFRTLAKQLNARNGEKAADTYRTLQGIGDNRFGFEEWVIDTIGQASLYGMFAAQFDDQALKAGKALKDRIKYNALTEEDKRRVKELKRALELAKAEAEKAPEAEKISGSKVESADTTAKDASKPELTLNRLKRELEEEESKPEAERNARKLRHLNAQIAALEATAPEAEPDETPAETPAEIETTEETPADGTTDETESN